MWGAKNGTIGFDPLPDLEELENPKNFLKYWETKFHSDWKLFKVRVDRLYSKFI